MGWPKQEKWTDGGCHSNARNRIESRKVTDEADRWL